MLVNSLGWVILVMQVIRFLMLTVSTVVQRKVFYTASLSFYFYFVMSFTYLYLCLVLRQWQDSNKGDNRMETKVTVTLFTPLSCCFTCRAEPAAMWPLCSSHLCPSPTQILVEAGSHTLYVFCFLISYWDQVPVCKLVEAVKIWLQASLF